MKVLKAMAEIARQRLAGDMLLHVSNAGDDGNSGVTPGQAIRTLNEFYRRVRSIYDLAGHTLCAQLADGEYFEDEITCVAATVGAVQAIVQGNDRANKIIFFPRCTEFSRHFAAESESKLAPP